VSRPAPALRSLTALAAHDLRLTARRGENVLVTIVIPIAVLLFFASTGIVSGLAGRPADYLVPGSIALAIVASGLVNLGIATAYERSYGVLKRLGGAPLPRWGLIVAKVASVLVLELVQVGALLAIGTLALGWAPATGWSPLLFVGALVLGTIAFASLGLLLAGMLRAEATLALANGLFLAFLMLGGIVLPLDHLPEAIRPVAALLPATALADLLRISVASGATATTAGTPLAAAILAAWAIGAAALTARTFRWE
jgi:ABC-2 type transport system permease protein